MNKIYYETHDQMVEDMCIVIDIDVNAAYS